MEKVVVIAYKADFDEAWRYVGFRSPLDGTAALATHLKERFGIGVGQPSR